MVTTLNRIEELFTCLKKYFPFAVKNIASYFGYGDDDDGYLVYFYYGDR